MQSCMHVLPRRGAPEGATRPEEDVRRGSRSGARGARVDALRGEGLLSLLQRAPHPKGPPPGRPSGARGVAERVPAPLHERRSPHRRTARRADRGRSRPHPRDPPRARRVPGAPEPNGAALARARAHQPSRDHEERRPAGEPFRPAVLRSGRRAEASPACRGCSNSEYSAVGEAFWPDPFKDGTGWVPRSEVRSHPGVRLAPDRMRDEVERSGHEEPRGQPASPAPTVPPAE